MIETVSISALFAHMEIRCRPPDPWSAPGLPCAAAASSHVVLTLECRERFSFVSWQREPSYIRPTDGDVEDDDTSFRWIISSSLCWEVSLIISVAAMMDPSLHNVPANVPTNFPVFFVLSCPPVSRYKYQHVSFCLNILFVFIFHCIISLSRTWMMRILVF